MFHFAGSGGVPLGALNSSLQVRRQGDWAWMVVARRMRQTRVRMPLCLKEDGLASLDNPPFARNAKDGAPELWADTEMVPGGSMVIIGDTPRETRAVWFDSKRSR